MNRHGAHARAIYLEERVALYAPDIPQGNDVAVEIIVQGVDLASKAKRDELEALGVRYDRFRNFYIDVIDPAAARGE